VEWVIFCVGFVAMGWLVFKMSYTFWRPIQVHQRSQGIVWPLLAPIFDVVFWCRLLALGFDALLTVGAMLFARLTVPGRVGAAVGGSIGILLSFTVFIFEYSITKNMD
jgi:hypothetical protein